MNIRALSRATIGTTILTVVLTIWTEFSKKFKDLLTSVTGHHWVTKSVFAVILFILLTAAFSKSTEETSIKKEIQYVLWAVILGSLIIFLFYIWHFFSE